MVHASIIDACRLSFADGPQVPPQQHEGPRAPARVPRRPRPRKLIVVDGVFSMEGDIADLPGIVPLAQEIRRADHGRRRPRHRRPRRERPGHGRALRPRERDRHRHGHVQQDLRLDRRGRGRREDGHLLHQAPRPAAHLQRRGDPGLGRFGPGHPGHPRDAAGARRARLWADHRADADGLPGHGLRHRPVTDAHHPRARRRRREVLHALEAPAARRGSSRRR